VKRSLSNDSGPGIKSMAMIISETSQAEWTAEHTSPPFNSHISRQDVKEERKRVKSDSARGVRSLVLLFIHPNDEPLCSCNGLFGHLWRGCRRRSAKRSRVRKVIRFQSRSDGSAMARVPNACQILMSMLLLIVWIDPSSKQELTNPPCQLLEVKHAYVGRVVLDPSC